jgi:hypothetical protein
VVQDKSFEAAQMSFMRFLCRVTRRDKIIRENIGRKLRVVLIMYDTFMTIINAGRNI